MERVIFRRQDFVQQRGGVAPPFFVDEADGTIELPLPLPVARQVEPILEPIAIAGITVTGITVFGITVFGITVFGITVATALLNNRFDGRILGPRVGRGNTRDDYREEDDQPADQRDPSPRRECKGAKNEDCAGPCPAFFFTKNPPVPGNHWGLQAYANRLRFFILRPIGEGWQARLPPGCSRAFTAGMTNFRGELRIFALQFPFERI